MKPSLSDVLVGFAIAAFLVAVAALEMLGGAFR